jgi:hypothetical protein
MPSGLPGPAGAAVFVGIKFAGYFLAGKVLVKCVAAVQSSALKIASLRTVLGVVLGPAISIFWLWLVSLAAWRNSWADSGYVWYVGLALARILIWAFVLFVFSRRSEFPAARLWLVALLCAAWSCLLDLPGYALANLAPGRLTIC